MKKSNTMIDGIDVSTTTKDENHYVLDITPLESLMRSKFEITTPNGEIRIYDGVKQYADAIVENNYQLFAANEKNDPREKEVIDLVDSAVLQNYEVKADEYFFRFITEACYECRNIEENLPYGFPFVLDTIRDSIKEKAVEDTSAFNEQMSYLLIALYYANTLMQENNANKVFLGKVAGLSKKIEKKHLDLTKQHEELKMKYSQLCNEQKAVTPSDENYKDNFIELLAKYDKLSEQLVKITNENFELLLEIRNFSLVAKKAA